MLVFHSIFISFFGVFYVLILQSYWKCVEINFPFNSLVLQEKKGLCSSVVTIFYFAESISVISVLFFMFFEGIVGRLRRDLFENAIKFWVTKIIFFYKCLNDVIFAQPPALRSLRKFYSVFSSNSSFKFQFLVTKRKTKSFPSLKCSKIKAEA